MEFEMGQIVFLAAMFALSIFDIRFRRVPDVIIFIWLVAGVLHSWRVGGIGLVGSLAGVSAGMLHLLFYCALARCFFGVREYIGGADIKILMAIGAWFGWQSVLLSMAVATLLAWVWSIAVDERRGVPFVPFLFIGTLAGTAIMAKFA